MIGAPPITAAVTVRDLYLSFGGLRVLNGVDLEIPAGRITALIGANGAGKTTFVNVLTGALHQDQGSLLLGKAVLDGLPTYKRARLGLCRTYQLGRLFASFSVREAVTFAATPGVESHILSGLLASVRRRPPSRAALVDRVLAECKLEHAADAPCGSLGYGDTKLLMLAQVMAKDGSVFCLDELCAGLEPSVIRHVGQLMQRLCTEGKAVLLIEHNLQLVRDLAQHVIFLHEGTVFRRGSVATVLEDPEVVRLYLGK